MKPRTILASTVSPFCRKATFSLAAAVAAALAGQSAQADNTWDGGGSGLFNWSDPLNWGLNVGPTFGTLTFAGILGTTNTLDANITMNQLLWTGSNAWTLNSSGGSVISLFDNGGVQAKIENQSTGLVTINAPITFAATAGAAWGEINAVSGDLTFGSTGPLVVNGTALTGIRMFGANHTTTFNNTVSAAGKYFATTGASAGTVEVGGAFTSGDFYLMNGSTLKLNTGGSITTTGLRLGGDFATTGAQNQALGATFQLTAAAGAQTFAGNINSGTGNTSNALLVDSLNTSGTNTLSGGVFLDSPLTFQQAAGGTLAITGVVSNGSSLTKSGAGTLTLSNANSYSGGTILNAGTILISNASALGTGALTVSGSGTINNTSGAAMTFPAAKALNLNGDLAFTGSNNLNFNGGILTVGGAAGTRILAVNAGVLSVKSLVGPAGYTLSKTGAGTLALTSTVNNETVFAGTLGIAAGIVQVAAGSADHRFGAITGTGIYENGGTANKWMRTNAATDFTFGGTIRNGTARIGYEKEGLGTATLTGTLGAPASGLDVLSITNGKVTLAASATAYIGGAAYGTVQAGTASGQNGILSIEGATLNSLRTTTPQINIGTAAGSRGFLTMTSGTITTLNATTGEIWISNNATSFGEFTMSGGTVTTGNWVAVGRGGLGILNISGGTINVSTNPYTHGSFAGSAGNTNVTGGTINVNSVGAVGMYMAEAGNGTLNLLSGAVNIAPTATRGLNLTNGVGTGIANLDGGTLTAATVTKIGGGSGTLNFGGGTLRANISTATFLQGLTNAYIYSGGANVDSNGFDVAIAQPLNAPTASGVSAIAVTDGGAGYVDKPFVTLTGGTGNGASAVANVVGGIVTGFTITNPGTGYTAGDVLAATLFGGGATVAATVGTITLTDNATTGGLTKKGNGTLTITSTSSSYNGPTTISAGKLSISSISDGGTPSNLGASSSTAGNLVLDGGTFQYTGGSASSNRGITVPTGKTGFIEVTGAGSILTFSGGTAATTGNFTKTGAGILSFTGANAHTGTTNANGGILTVTGTSVGPFTVGAGRLNAGYQAVGALTIPSLLLGAGSGLDFDFGLGNDIITISTIGGLTLGTTTLNLYQAGGTTAFATNGTYTLLDYDTSYTGALLGAFSVANSQPGKIYSIANNVALSTIEITIGDSLNTTWNLDGGGTWGTIGNWTVGVPNGIGATANFGAILTAPNAPAAVAVGGPKTVGNIVISNPNTYNITGGAADILTLNNGLGTATLSVTAGSHSVSAPIVLVNPSNFSTDSGTALTISGSISGSVLSKTGAGIVTLAGANSYTVTNVSGGILQIGTGSTTGTLGTGAVTIGTGATLSLNRSDAITVANNISGDGILSDDGTGTVTYTGTATHTGITDINAGTFTSSGTINGTSALNVDNASANLDGNLTTGIGGTLNIAGAAANTATLSIRGTTVATASGGINVGTGTGSTGILNILASASATFAGPINIATGTGFTGTLNINTTGTVSTAVDVNVGNGFGTNGTLKIDAGTFTQTNGTLVYVGRNGGTGTYTQSGGTVTTGTAGMRFGVDGSGSIGNGTLSGTGSITTAGEFWLSNGAGNSSTFTMSGGAINTGSWFVVGRTSATGTLNLSGGTITKGGAANNYTIIGSLAGTGTVNQTGGAFNTTAGGIRIGENNGVTPALNGLWDMQGGTSTVTGEINIGWRSSQATWTISGTSTVNATGRLIVAAETSNATANSGVILNGNPVGIVNISGGTVTFAGADNRIGGDIAPVAAGTNSASVGANGTVNVSGGVLNFGNNLQIGAYGIGNMNISGTGAVNVTAGFPVVGRFIGGLGTLTLTGGTFTQSGLTNLLIIGEEGTGTLNINGGLVDTQGLRIGHAATGNGTVNLNGGTLTTASILKTNAGSTGTFKFNGGVLKTTADSPDFLQSFLPSSITIENGGAFIDTNAHLIGITQGLAPGLASTGGLTKQGNGTLTLSGTNSYIGATVIGGGTLALTGSISASTAITAKTGTFFDVTGATFSIVSGQTLGGNGTILGTVGTAAGGRISPGESIGTLNFSSSLDITNAITAPASAALVFELGTATAHIGTGDKAALSAGTLSIGSGALEFDDFNFTATAGFAPIAGDTYVLFDTTQPIIGTLGANLTGFIGSASATLSISGDGTDILLTVPEPGSAALILGGLGILTTRRRRRY